MPEFIKIQLMENGKSAGSYIERSERVDVADLFDGAAPGEQYLLTLIEMSEQDYAALPEFMGF